MNDESLPMPTPGMLVCPRHKPNQRHRTITKVILFNPDAPDAGQRPQAFQVEFLLIAKPQTMLTPWYMSVEQFWRYFILCDEPEEAETDPK